MSDDPPRYSSLRDYLRLVRKQWLLILVPAVIGAGAAYFFSSRTAKTYDASAAVSIQDETQLLELLGTSVYPGAAPGTSPQVVAQTIDTPALAQGVKRRLRTRLPREELRGLISLSVDSTSGLVNVTASTGSGAFAARVANAFAAQIAVDTTSAARRQFASAITTLSRRLHQLGPTTLANAAERSNLETEISRLEFLHSNSTPGQVAKSADVPGAPASPKPARDAALGLAAGLLLGLILAFLRESLDRRLRGSAEIKSELGYRLLGQVRARTMGRAVQPSSVLDKEVAGDVETFRIMRRNVEFLVPDSDQRAILVTSGLPEEGKSTVAASLALASAVTGRRTLLIEADLRRPSLAERLSIESSPGLTDYLAGKAEPREILRTIPVRAPEPHHRNGSSPSEPDNALVCVPAGSSSPRSAELLASGRMASLLRDVAQVYELVLIDTAPLLPVADTLEMLAHVNGVMLCVRSGRSTRDQARAVKAALAHVPADSIGIVVTGLQTRDEPAGYGLYPYYYSTPERVSERIGA